MQLFYPPKPGDSPLLATVIRAVFMALFSSSREYHPALYHARVTYGSALTLTRKAIQSPEEAIMDTTLCSLLLLSVFERLTNSGDVRSGHLQGALGLVLLRGDNQFSDRIGITMFLQLTELIFLNCLANETDIPSHLLSLRHKALKNVDVASSPKWRFSEVMLQYAQLKSSIRSGLLSHEQTISWAETLDHELDQISRHLPPFTSRKLSRQPLRMSAIESDIYPDYNTRRSWNNIRVVRILLAEIVREQYIRLLGTSTDGTAIVEKLHESTRNAISLCSEICFSVPYKYSQGMLSSELSSVQIATLSFHLYVAKEAGVVSGQMRSSILERLQSLRERKKLSGHEKLMTELLEQSSERPKNIWKVWLRIGKEDYSI
jgi:hypothetical protein